MMCKEQLQVMESVAEKQLVLRGGQEGDANEKHKPYILQVVRSELHVRSTSGVRRAQQPRHAQL